MVNLIKNVIMGGGYKLSEIQYKVKKLYLMGDITEEEFDNLLAMASNGVSLDGERPEVLTMLKTLSERMDGMERRLAALEEVEDTCLRDFLWLCLCLAMSAFQPLG